MNTSLISKHWIGIERTGVEKFRFAVELGLKMQEWYETGVMPEGIDPIKRAVRIAIKTREASTRTAISSHIAADMMRVLCESLYIKEVASTKSSEGKNDKEMEVLRTLVNYRFDILALRTEIEGGPEFYAQELTRNERNISIIDLGSGRDKHPSQAGLDAVFLTRMLKGKNIKTFKLGICGDMLNSRVVRSLIPMLQAMGGVLFEDHRPKY